MACGAYHPLLVNVTSLAKLSRYVVKLGGGAGIILSREEAYVKPLINRQLTDINIDKQVSSGNDLPKSHW